MLKKENMAVVQDIPKSLIYEMVDGKPIYYKGYKDYLNKTAQLEEIMGSSYLQALIATQLIILLSQKLDFNKHLILSNEIGLKFNHKSWRAADIAIFEKQQLRHIPKENKYLEIPPKVVIEIDTKASLEEIQNPLGYYQEKTDQLLNFGVERVIWIFSDTEKVMSARRNEDWQISSWDKQISIFDDIEFNVAQIVKNA